MHKQVGSVQGVFALVYGVWSTPETTFFHRPPYCTLETKVAPGS